MQAVCVTIDNNNNVIRINVRFMFLHRFWVLWFAALNMNGDSSN